MMPISSRMGPHADVPIIKNSKDVILEPSKGKAAKEPPTLENVKEKTIAGLIIDYQLRQLMSFAWLALTVFQLACLAVGVLPNMTLFSTMYNVIHKGLLTYFQVASPSYSFLYTKKVDEVESSRWFNLWFLARGGFSDEVRAHWSLANTTLASEDYAKTQAEVEKLREGFPNALPHEVFCDRDVLIKARLTKGVDNFPRVTLLNLLLQKGVSGSCIMPHKVSFKVITSRKGPFARISKRKGISAQGPPSPPPADPVNSLIRDRVPSSEEAPASGSSRPLLPPGSYSVSVSPLLEVRYSLPSGVTVTEGAISRRDTPTTSLLLKNCMLKKEMEGVLHYSTPNELYDSFSHFQLKLFSSLKLSSISIIFCFNYIIFCFFRPQNVPMGYPWNGENLKNHGPVLKSTRVL
ncbi:hypothetical protein LIER_24367 [Lithospermum erythrorhizon]|uniref:Uncharacterized protein n=1 Tax=Lithospermum erythrorhizon TaxID=34254 RepID=A0AAV3R324_LITER